MKFILQKNFLYFNNLKFPCAVGKNGITENKKEGDGCTPAGVYKFNEIYYRADKLESIIFNKNALKISKNDGWCDDPDSEFYNQFIKFPFAHSAEKLYREDDLYDIVCVINYNISPTEPGKGSAIFLHIAHADYRGTLGCIALSKEDLLKIVNQINSDTVIEIKN